MRDALIVGVAAIAVIIGLVVLHLQEKGIIEDPTPPPAEEPAPPDTIYVVSKADSIAVQEALDGVRSNRARITALEHRTSTIWNLLLPRQTFYGEEAEDGA